MIHERRQEVAKESVSLDVKRAFPFRVYGRGRPGRTASSTAVPRWFADTEGVTGSNPVAPTTVVAGQSPVRARRTALLTCRGRAAAAVCSPAKPDGPFKAGRQGANTSSTTTQRGHHLPGPAPWSGITPATCPGRTYGGLCEHLLLPCSPANRPAPWRWTSFLGREAASVAPQPMRVRSGGPGLPSTLVRAMHCRRTIFPSPSGRFRQRRPSRSRTTARRRSGCTGRGHRTPVRPDTRIAPVAWTPDAWTPDVRPTSWTDVRTADRGRGQRDERRGWRPDILDGQDDGDRRLGYQTSLGLQRLRRSATHDGSAVTTLPPRCLAAVQCCST
jgi:hypothetical protein